MENEQVCRVWQPWTNVTVFHPTYLRILTKDSLCNDSRNILIPSKEVLYLNDENQALLTSEFTSILQVFHTITCV